MHVQDLLNQDAVIDLGFFNFRNAVTACYFADDNLAVQRVNENFGAFFPVLKNVPGVQFLDILEQLGIERTYIDSFEEQLAEKGKVLIPAIPLTIEGEERVFSLLSTRTSDPDFPYLNGVQGQFIDRTEEHRLRREREQLMEDRLRDREIIEEKTQKLEAIANRLAKYLSPQIYDSIFSGDGSPQQRFLRKNLTVFFSDIESFTEITDGMEPERLAFIINTYLSEMSQIAIEFGGTIDKFIGDAILIFFGDPQTQGERNDALRAIRMALRMRQRIAELDGFFRDQGATRSLRVRMGISTGYCTVGDFGSDHRLEYTVLGSPVNMAARLQSAAEAGDIIISETTHALIADELDCSEHGQMTPKGFVRPIATYLVNGMKALSEEDGERSMVRMGQHVQVNVIDRRNIREAIAELRRIEEEFENASSVPD
jgi:adenylate cyclase